MKILIILMFAASCGETKFSEMKLSRIISYDCKAVRQSLAKFINTCIKNGNPKSDEEPEDWIGKCEGMGERTLCRKRYSFEYRHDYMVRKRGKCKDAKTLEEKDICAGY